MDLDGVGSGIEFRNVSFHYSEGNPVLRDVSFSVQAGETVALVSLMHFLKEHLYFWSHTRSDVVQFLLKRHFWRSHKMSGHTAHFGGRSTRPGGQSGPL